MKLVTEHMENFLDVLKLKPTYVCGDFNINLVKYNDHQDTQDFINQFLYAYGFYSLINLPTQITCNSSTLIDKIFTNVIDTDMKNGLLISDISDHLPIITWGA